MIDDHSRLAYVEIHDDEKGTTAAGVLARAIAFYASLGITVKRVISDNAFAYRHSTAFRDVCATHSIEQRFIKPHCPWTNGKVERLNRTLATEWAYARPYTSNTERAQSLQPWLDYHNLGRAHLGLNGCITHRQNHQRSRTVGESRSVVSLAVTDGWGQFGFVLSALVTSLTALEPFFNWRSRWVDAEDALAAWYEVDEDLRMLVASTPEDELTHADVARHYKRYRSTWNNWSASWISARRASE